MSEPEPAREPGSSSLGLTDDELPRVHHVCLIYTQEEERRRILSDFMAVGIRQGETVRYLADTTAPEDIRAWLSEIGVEVGAAERSGRFAIGAAEGAYCPGGTFDPDGMIARNKQRYLDAEQSGFAGTRTTGEMTWALRGGSGYERFLEYEALLNTLTARIPFVGMCQYDARRFDGATLFDVLQVHPFMVARGQLVKNPYYTRPEQFLAGRRAAAPSA